MRNYKFGKSSLSHMESVNLYLRAICFHAQYLANEAHPNAAIPDWGYSCGLRTKAQQQELYAQGRTKPGNIITNIDGQTTKSMHQTGHALDFFAYVDGRANYEYEKLAVIAAVHMQAALDMGYRLNWGGTFESLCDAPHIEIVIF